MLFDFTIDISKVKQTLHIDKCYLQKVKINILFC